jgi:hypothetical protein
MRQSARIASLLVVAVAVLSPDACAGRYYPPGYGRYGWGGWGTPAVDPAGGYMAGLGSFARGQGVYELLDAEAQAINTETMKKWNVELRARQQALQEARRQADAAAQAQREARVERMELEDGTTLNNLLMQIYGFDPTAARSSRAQAPLGAAAVREIPFEWNTEAITICINQLTARDALPLPLTEDTFAADRSGLGQAVEAALQEDAKGDVSAATMKRLTSAIASFRARFLKLVSKDDPDYGSCEDYFSTLGSLSRLLHDPSMKKALGELESVRAITVGDLISFMQTYNLRFGPVTTAQQLQIYQTLVGLLKGVLNDFGPAPAPAPAPPPPAPGIDPKDGKALQNAAKGAFKDMDWQHLDAHARP